MSPKKRIKTCCIIKCTNTQANSKVNFFSFPELRHRSYQRNRWVQAIKNINALRSWMPTVHSFVCSDHFMKGQPSTYSRDTDYVPSIFINKRKAANIKSRAVSVKTFGLEYIKHGALLEKPSRGPIANNDQRKSAYVKLAATFGIPVTTVRSWERRFREYVEEKMAESPDDKPSRDGKPHWIATVAKRLSANPMLRLGGGGGGGAVSPGGVVAALCAAARARGTLCATALYNDVRRVLRLSSAVNDLHAIWVSAQRVSLQQVVVAGRAGDAAAAAPPPAAAAVADLVLLHTDVDIVTDESVTLYEESAALHTLWQLVQRHRLEDAAPAHSRVRAQRWTRAHRSYLESGRTVSLVVLQRRWYELKLQARVRLAMHWRRPPEPQLFDDLTPAPDPAPDPGPDPGPDHAPAPGPDLDPAPASTPHEVYPRPAPLHIAILKRYPHIATGQFKSWRQQVSEGTIVTEPLEEENDEETQSNNNEQSTDTSDTGDKAAVKQLYSNVSKVEQPTFDEPMVEQPPDNDPFTEGPTDTGLLEIENDVRETKSNITTDTTDTGADAAVKQLYPNMSKVEQPTVDEPKIEQTYYVPLVEQSTADDQLGEHTTDKHSFAEETTVREPKVEQAIGSGSLTDNHIAEETTASDLLSVQSTVDKPKIATDCLINQSTGCTLIESPVGHVGIAATADIPDMLDTPDTQGRPDIASAQIHHAQDKSNEVIPPKRTYSSDIDTDTEDNLVIDECYNKTPCSLKPEPVPHTETHSFDTVSPLAAPRNIAPIIEVLHMIDPNTVKTEILFESDEDDFQPCNEVDKDEIELDSKKEVSFISNRIMFVDEEPEVICDVKSEDDVTGRMDWEDAQKMDDPVNDTPTIDPKLLMDTQVRLIKIDEIRAWMSNVRKDNSIRVSRIPKRYYALKPKNKCTNTRTQNKRLDVELRPSARLTTTKTQEIRVDKSCLDKVANTHSIRLLCRNIKRELIEEQLEVLADETPNKKAKTESDLDDDKPLLVLTEGEPRETTDETGDTVVREMVEESSSDDELLNDEMFNKLRGEERKRGRGSYYAASTIEWSSAFAPALGRVAKRVLLPDIEQVRRYNSGMQVAQVAPITSTVGACGDDAMQAGQPLGAAAADDTPEAWRALDLPAEDELQAALDNLTAAPAEAVLARSLCCAARRHREVNDTRRRIGLVEIPLHNHPDGVCTCCCAHLSDADTRIRLDQQLRALHEDIEQMLRKSAGGRFQSKPAQKHSRSPSPARASTSATTASSAISATSATTATSPTMATSATTATSAITATTATTAKVATKYAPSNTTPVAKGSKAKPASYTNRPKRRRTRARAPPAPAPATPPPPVNDYEEWQRQKNMNAKYFHINSNFSSKKDKSTTARGTTAQATAIQSTTVQSTTSQATAVQSTTAQTVTKQNTISQSASPQQNVEQPGLMPYIRQSRLVIPLEEPPRARRDFPVPPQRKISPVNIAPKVTDMCRASEHAQHNTIVDKPATTPVTTNNLMPQSFQTQVPRSRRMNLTTEQVSEPNSQPVQVMRVTSAPSDQAMSILEEYSRTLTSETVNNTPVVNAFSLRVPSGPEGPKTTIVMALTLPSDDVIQQTINRLYANDTVDLTNDTETSKSVIPKTVSKQILTAPIDLVGAVKSLMNSVNKNKSGRSLLKPLTATNSGKSQLEATITSALDKPSDTTQAPVREATRSKALRIMALSNKLHDGDVIEIVDTDSNHSNSSDGNQSSNILSSILINKSCGPAVYANKGPDEVKSGSAKESSNQSTSRTDESSEQAATSTNSNEAVIKTKSFNQAVDKDKTSKKRRKSKKSSKERQKNRFAKPAVFDRSNASVEAVSSHSLARPCSRIPVLASLTDGSGRCPARFANVAAMTDFMATLRRAAAQADKEEVYCHKWSAVQQPVSALPCGGTLLCVDGSRPPLVLPVRNRRDPCDRRDRVSPNARAHLVLTDADPPCVLPTYWTLSSFGQMARVVPDELLKTDTPDVAIVPDEPDVFDESCRGGARWCAARGEWVMPKEARKICEKNHNFKILTAFCSADGIRQAARAGASLLLLSVLRARVVVLTLRRGLVRGAVRHRASADVEGELLRELEGLLDEAEFDEQVGGRADITGQSGDGKEVSTNEEAQCSSSTNEETVSNTRSTC